MEALRRALRHAARVGVGADEFWRLTAHELRLIVEARSREAARRSIATGWWSGYYRRVKHFPSTLQGEFDRCGLGDHVGPDIDEYGQEEAAAADARIMAWASALRKARDGDAAR